MDIKFTEIDNFTDDLNKPKYWEQQTQKKVEVQKKKKVTFDDILINMNLTVNQNGVLQSMAPLQQEQYQENYVVKNQDPLDPSVKHSYIFNKYFKDYRDANDKPVIEKKVPKTIEEYKQMVLEERIKRIQERNRIAQIKSTKMLFTSHPNMSENINHRVIKSSKNNLRSMKFS